jgi:lipopolysaccharide export system permease protein
VAVSVLKRPSLSRPRIIDSYIVREMVAPTALGLLVFTFVLLIDQIPRLLAVLVARSADLPTIVRVFVNLLPSIFAVTLPMSFLLGVLLAFGRLASDSEIVALRAVGVSPLRLLSPVMMLASVMTGVTFYVNAVALPAANQAHRELVFSLVVSKARTDVKPRTFNVDLLPGQMVLYVQDVDPPTGQWRNLLIHDTRDVRETKLILARTGQLVVDREKQVVRDRARAREPAQLLPERPPGVQPGRLRLDGLGPPGRRVLPRPQQAAALQGRPGDDPPRARRRDRQDARERAAPPGVGPLLGGVAQEVRIPAACLVFGLLGLGLSLGNRKEARSSAFALSIAVIFVYYVLLRLGEQAGDTGVMTPPSPCGAPTWSWARSPSVCSG